MLCCACRFSQLSTLTFTIALRSCVQARGIVVNGVVASPHPRWGAVAGRFRLPRAFDAHIPAVMEVLLTPLYLAYTVMGPEMAWRINQHPFFGEWSMFFKYVGNTLVWGQLVALAIGAVTVCRVRGHSSCTHKVKAD